MDVRTVIMCHNTPKTTERLYAQLSGLGRQVEVFDSGSDEDKRPGCPCERFGNLYWTGCWKEAMRRHGKADFLWVIGGDVSLPDEPARYYEALESASRYGVGCWSPAVRGSCRKVMSCEKTGGKVWSVYHLEGIALAASRNLMRMMRFSFPLENRYGWGLDMWMNCLGWEAGLRNILDGRVTLVHPETRGYNSQAAWDEMESWMERVCGKDWIARTRLEKRDGFAENIRERCDLRIGGTDV